MSNLIERFGPRYFNDRFAGAFVNIDNRLYAVDYADIGGRRDDEDEYDDDDVVPSEDQYASEVVCCPIDTDRKAIEYSRAVRISADCFSSMDVLVMPDNGYRRINKYQVGWMQRNTGYAHGINSTNVGADLSPFSRQVGRILPYDLIAQEIDNAMYFITEPEREHHLLPDLFAGRVANVILSDKAIIEPAPSQGPVPLWSVLYSGTLLGYVTADGEPYGDLANSNADLIKELLNNE